MNKNVVLFALLVSSLTITAQKKGATPVLSNDQQVFKNALQYNDVATAIQATHQIIAKEGPNSTYKDSLAILYFRATNYVSAHLVAKELLSNKPKDAVLLEINAVSLKQLNAPKEAIAAYEALLPISKNRYHAYELAQLQLGIARNGEALQTVTYAIENTESVKDASLQFPKSDKEVQQVPLDAALYNLKGLIAYELKDEKAAKAAFDEALKIFPEFVLAQQNVAALTQQAAAPAAKE